MVHNILGSVDILGVLRFHHDSWDHLKLYQGDPNQWGPIDSPFGRVVLIGGAD